MAEAAEIFMGVHAAAVEIDGNRVVLPVVGGVVLVPDARLSFDLENYLGLRWLQPNVSHADRVTEFTTWFQGLKEVRGTLQPNNSNTRLALTFWTLGPFATPLPKPPPPPTPIFGHLPFQASTPPDSTIYRWEAFPVSRKIDQINQAIGPDTFAAPESELEFVKSGFGATARYALPNLMPAMFRWELQPDVGTQVRCGASVPLYGQSGGGVEILFPSATRNRGPIANPIVLSPL